MNAHTAQTIPDLIASLAAGGVEFRLENGRLKCTGPDALLNGELSTVLREHSVAIREYLASDAADIPNADRDAPISLSFAQQRLWFLDNMQPGNPVYNLPLALDIEGPLDPGALASAIEVILKRHEILRTRFLIDGDEPRQVIDPSAPLSLDVEDISALPDPEAALARAAHEAASAGFDLSEAHAIRVNLVKVDNNKHVLLFTAHHIVADGWSLDVLLRELGVGYRAALLGLEPELPDLPTQYADFSAWQRQYLSGAVLDKQRQFWIAKLGGELPVLQLPGQGPRQRVQTFNGAVEEFKIPLAITEKLRALAANHHASLFIILLAAFKALLFRYTGQGDIVVGTPVAGRQRRELENLIGLFVNTLVLRSSVASHQTFAQLLALVRNTVLDAYEHQDLPFEKLVEELQPERDLSVSPLFQIKFRLENAPSESIELPGLQIRRRPHALITAKLDLSVDMYETTDGLVGAFEYNADLFSAATMAKMAAHFVTFVDSIAADPEMPIAELKLLDDIEHEQIVNAWNNKRAPYQDHACFHQLFEQQVERSPAATAVVFDGEKRLELSYQQLNQRANQLAHHLISRGVSPEDVVAIGVERSTEMVVALLAVLKAGAAYLPLDVTYPVARLEYMLEDAGAVLLLSTQGLELPHGIERVDLDALDLESQPSANPNISLTPEHLAYLIYTSGSTGKPKGALIPHGGLVNLTEDKIRVCRVEPGDAVLQFFSFSFDASVPEFIMSLGVGARLVLAPSEKLLPGPELSTLLARNAITHITMTPSALSALPLAEYPALKMVLVGGEAPAPDLIEKWCARRRFINAYGPTETTVNASMVVCGNGEPLEPTVLPSTNKQLYVLGDALQIQPIGVVGELHVAGVGLARGYHGQGAMTAERFVPNPFNGEDSAQNSPVLYKTGDLACQLSDGRIRLLGRIDHQTKIRGFRVEVGEVEHILSGHPAIDAAVVTIREDQTGNRRLLAFGVRRNGCEATPSEIRQFVAEKLPRFMVPSTFTWLEALPLTVNGKVDLKALPDPEREAVFVAPRNDREAMLTEQFASLLEIEKVGVDDNFFELGGHSLLATRLVAALLEAYEVEVTVMDLFDAPTPATLAERIVHKEQLAKLIDSPEDAGDEEEREEFAL